MVSWQKSEYPGVAKFGIALEWGSRGRWFESSHSDQTIRLESVNFRVFFLLFENFFEPDYTAGLLVPVTNASKNASKTQDK